MLNHDNFLHTVSNKDSWNTVEPLYLKFDFRCCMACLDGVSFVVVVYIFICKNNF